MSTIYVGGISFDTNERSLQDYFEKFGNVVETKARSSFWTSGGSGMTSLFSLTRTAHLSFLVV